MTEFKTITVEQMPYLYVERSCSMDPKDISANMGAAFQQVWAHMQANQSAPAGAALSVYHDYNPDKMAFRAGFTIAQADMDKTTDVVKADATPAGKVLYFRHEGSYATLRDDYGLMMQHITQTGLELSAPTWELYLNSPDEVPEEELLTDVFVALAG